MEEILGLPRSPMPVNSRSTQGISKTLDLSGFAPSHFLPENQRFHGKSHEVEREQRQQQFFRKQIILQKKREARVQDYNNRWKTIEKEESKELERLRNKGSQWKLGMKNNLGQAYNPITLEYDNTSQGRQLQQRDQAAGSRHRLRMNHMDSRANSGVNPITGQLRNYGITH